MERINIEEYVTPILWVGPLEETRRVLHRHIINTVAICKGCTKCHFCYSLRISAQGRMSHYVPPCVVWLAPREHGYVREQIDEALTVLSVAIDIHEASAFVIESADQLHSSSANRLLKIIEEPPAGWHIILTTERPAEVLPTLRSRCIEKTCHGDDDSSIAGSDTISIPYDGLPSLPMLWLEDPQASTWFEVISKTEDLPKTVPATLNAVDRLTTLWHKRWVEQGDPRSLAMVSILTEMGEKPPLSGGTAGFWRVLLLKVYKASQSL